MLINNLRYVAEIAQSLAAIGVLADRIALLRPHSGAFGRLGPSSFAGKEARPPYTNGQWAQT